MAKHAIGDVYVELGTDDISNRVAGVKVSLGRTAVDVTAIGDAWADYVTGGVSRWAVALDLYQDYCSSDVGATSIYDLAMALMNDTAGTTFVCRPTSAAAGRVNPQISGAVVLDSDFDILNAAVGQANRLSVTLKGMATPTFTDSSS